MKQSKNVVETIDPSDLAISSKESLSPLSKFTGLLKSIQDLLFGIKKQLPSEMEELSRISLHQAILWGEGGIGSDNTISAHKYPGLRMFGSLSTGAILYRKNSVIYIPIQNIYGMLPKNQSQRPD